MVEQRTLPPAPDFRLQAACAELDRRLRSGESRPAEAVLAAFPEVAADPDSALQLVYEELVGRERLGEQPAYDEYYQRFPQWQVELRKSFDIHEALVRHGSGPGAATPLSGSPRESESAKHQPAVSRRYELLGEVGRGGMGVVYRARQPGLSRIVALKMILAGEYASAEDQARFRREAETAARLQHPNIVQVYEVGEQDGRPFLAMEYVEGSTLADRLNGTGLASEEAARLVETLARAVQYAHDHGVLHRDLKPANIILQNDETRRTKDEGTTNDEIQNQITTPDAGSAPPPSSLGISHSFDTRHSSFVIPKITDFGLAKFLSDGPDLSSAEGQTQTGKILGTPSYMAPEQARGSPGPRRRDGIGPAVDVWALGAILYEALTGRPPFLGETALETVQQVLSQEPLPPSQLRPKLQRDLETICLKCLQKDPLKRYARSGDLADDLERYLAKKPIRARPVSAVARIWRWCQRKPAVASLVAALTVLAIGSLVGLMILWQRAERALVAESDALSQAREALDEMSSELVDEWLGKQQQLEPHHEAFLKKALAYYERFAGQGAETEEARMGLAGALRRVGNIRAKLGLHHEAEAAYLGALDAYRALAADFPSRPEFRRELAMIHNQLGVLLKDTRPQEAESAYSSALALFRQLAAEFPDQPDYLREVARTHNNTGVLLQQAGQLKQAESAHRDALTLFKQLAAEFPSRSDFRFELARSFVALAILFRGTRMSQEGEAAWRDALVLQKQLAAEFPNRPDFRFDLARSHFNLGYLLAATRQRPQAETAYRDALTIQTQLAADFPTRPEYRDELAGTYNNLAILLRETHRLKEAESALRDALALKKHLATDFPRPEYRQALARSHNNLGKVVSAMGRLDEAEARYREALTLQKQLVADFPRRPGYRFELAGTHHHVAMVLRETGRLKEAESSFRNALTLFKQLAADLPAVPAYQIDVANTLDDLAVLANRQRKFVEACGLADEALPSIQRALKANPRDPFYRAVFQENRQVLAEARLGLGEHAAAARAVEEMTRLESDPMNDAYKGAGLLARCMPLAEKDGQLPNAKRKELADGYANQAVALLRLAIEKGYKDIAHVGKDSDLDPLRQRDDFKRLMAKLEEKAKAGTK